MDVDMDLILNLPDSYKTGVMQAYGSDPAFIAVVHALEKQIVLYMTQPPKVRERTMPEMLRNFVGHGTVGGVMLLEPGVKRQMAAAVALSNVRKKRSYVDFIVSSGGSKRQSIYKKRRSPSASKKVGAVHKLHRMFKNRAKASKSQTRKLRSRSRA